MGLFKKGGNWWIDLRVGGRGSKRVRKRIGPSKKAAEAELARQRLAIVEGRYLPRTRRQRVRMPKLAEEYLEFSQANKRNYKQESYMMPRILKAFGNRQVGEVTAWLGEKFKSELVKSGYTAATANRYLALLKHMFTKAVEWGYLDAHPLKSVKQLKERNQRLRYLSSEELAQLLEVSSPYLRVVIIVAVNTGLRKGELMRLTWADINFASGFIAVSPQTKNGQPREVPMNGAVRNALLGLKRGAATQRVFPRGFRERFEATVRRAGIADFRFHDLRHTFASHLIMRGVDVRAVQELLGHKTLAVTMRYTHLSPGHCLEAVKKLDGFMEPRCGHPGGHQGLFDELHEAVQSCN